MNASLTRIFPSVNTKGWVQGLKAGAEGGRSPYSAGLN